MISKEEFENSGYAEELKKYGDPNSPLTYDCIINYALASAYCVCAARDKNNKNLLESLDMLMRVCNCHSNNFGKFSQEFADNVALIYQDIENKILRAKLAEFVSFWKSGQEKIKAVQTAIKAYTSEPISAGNGFFVAEYWGRGLQLAKRFGQKDEFARIKKELLQQLYADDNGIALDIADRCITPNLVNKTEANTIAAYFEKLASQKDDRSASAYYDKAILFYDKAKNENKRNEMYLLKGQSLERLVSDVHGGNFMEKEEYYPKAIEAYQKIPGKKRPSGLDDHIKELRKDRLDSSRAAMENPEEHGMSVRHLQIQVPDMTVQAEKAVSGKTFLSAMSSLAQSMSWFQKSEARAHSLSRVCSRSTGSPDGRVQNFSDTHPYGQQAPDILDHYRMCIEDHSAGIINMLSVIKKEHSNITEEDFLAMTQDNPIIPPDRAGLVAKALYYGYQGDFSAALHLAIPQIENIVRHHMKRVGILTTKQDKGDETEISLSALLEKPEAEQAFSKDIIFELRSLLCVKGGPNLRNAVAHGLLNDEQSQDANAVYAWHILQKLCQSQICDGKVE